MRISSIVAGAMLALGLAACSDSSKDVTTTDVSPATGTFALKSVDGAALPWTDTAHNTTLIGVAVDVSSDGTVVNSVSYLDGTTGSDHGTIAVSGNSVTVTQASGQVYMGTLADGVLTLNAGGHVMVYQQL